MMLPYFFFFFMLASFILFYNVCSQQIRETTKCFPSLKNECFTISKDSPWFDSKWRPKTVLPQNLDKIGIKFHLYTRSKPNISQLATFDDLTKLNTFNSSKPTKLIIHGFVDGPLLSTWMQTLKNEYLKRYDCNVFITDWSAANRVSYEQATANIRVAGAVIAIFLNKLMQQKGLKLNHVHILGHSLGAHTAGYVGKRFPLGKRGKDQQIKRITGFDPAGPYFENMKPIVRLQPSDAQFVDVIHSNAADPPIIVDITRLGHLYRQAARRGLGISAPCGHIDFYPNGGSDQTGCKRQIVSHLKNRLIPAALISLAACKHYRAVEYFIPTINNANCIEKAYECQDYDTFKKGKCSVCSHEEGKACGQLGEDVDTNNQFIGKKFFLRTGASSPFCCRGSACLIQSSMDLSNKTDINLRIIPTARNSSEVEDFLRLGSGLDEIPEIC